MSIERETYGRLPGGESVEKFVLRNSLGIKLNIISYGGIVTSLEMPGRDGTLANITLGLETLADYLAGHPYFGSLVGRVGNRIASGIFQLDGHSYSLAQNDGDNHLHGGVRGFDKVLWKADCLEKENSVRLSYLSPDGEEGYPGNLEVEITYSLNDNNEFTIVYRAETDRATPINLTNHAYWNLAGAGSGPIYDHELSIFCPQYLPVDEKLIPTGVLAEVGGTAMDFRDAKRIGRDIEQVPGGYDHCYALKPFDGSLTLIARVKDPESGRCLEVSTTKPAVQLYSANFLDGVKGAGGLFNKHDALCLETQYYPDAVNQPDFPDWILRPGQEYLHRTVHRFYID